MRTCMIEHCKNIRVRHSHSELCKTHYNEFKRAEYHKRKHLPRVYAKNNPKKGSLGWLKKRFTWIKNYDVRKAHPKAFDFTFEEFCLFVKQSCYYCEDSSELTGLDRIDNSLGHSKNNVIPCCKLCNKTRNNNFTVEQFKLIGAVIKDIKQKNKLTDKKSLG